MNPVEFDYLSLADELHRVICSHWHDTMPQRPGTFGSPAYLKEVEDLVTKVTDQAGLKLAPERTTLIACNIPFIDFEPMLEGPDDQSAQERFKLERVKLASVLQRVITVI